MNVANDIITVIESVHWGILWPRGFKLENADTYW